MGDGLRRRVSRLMSRRLWRGTAVAVAGLACVAAVGLVRLDASAAVAPNRFVVENHRSGMCLAYTGSGNGAPVVLAGCQANATRQQWRFTRVADPSGQRLQ